MLSTELSLQELAQLTETAGAEVIDTFIQKRNKPDTAYFMGKGFAENLGLICEEKNANLIITDDELSGTQIRNLENITGVKIIDRTALILDIFAQRATSMEGKLQVELAQLNYRLPRLTGRGLYMSRLAGGIGTRGPGETKLETDRRHIKKKITDIKKQIQQLYINRKIKRSGRNPNFPLVVLVGYTNAGKSSIRYLMLKERAAKTSNLTNEDPGTNKLFATLDPTIRGINLNNGQTILLADTVGFIQKLPHQLISAFKTTLDEVLNADILLHVVDISNPNNKEQQEAVFKVLNEIGARDTKRITIYNKIDLVDLLVLPPSLDASPVVAFSAKTGYGLDKLLNLIEQELQNKTKLVELLLPFNQGGLLSEIYNYAQVLEKKYLPEGMWIKAKIPNKEYFKLKNFILKIF